jgi:MtN3 and saliva related transmembrane protein
MNLIGLVVSVLTVSAFVPQAYKAVKTRQTRDLSLPTYAIIVTTGTLWTIYGIGRHDPALYVTNSLVGLLALVICIVKIRDKD